MRALVRQPRRVTNHFCFCFGEFRFHFAFCCYNFCFCFCKFRFRFTFCCYNFVCLPFVGKFTVFVFVLVNFVFVLLFVVITFVFVFVNFVFVLLFVVIT